MPFQMFSFSVVKGKKKKRIIEISAEPRQNFVHAKFVGAGTAGIGRITTHFAEHTTTCFIASRNVRLNRLIQNILIRFDAFPVDAFQN